MSVSANDIVLGRRVNHTWQNKKVLESASDMIRQGAILTLVRKKLRAVSSSIASADIA